jgi:phosphate acetyltransferase
MSRSVYLATSEGDSGKSTVALGIVELLTRQVDRVGVFRPLTENVAVTDPTVELLLAQPGITQSYADAIGVGYADMHADADGAIGDVVEKFQGLQERFDALVVLGSDYTDVATSSELAFNAKIAANLGIPVILVVHGRQRQPSQVRTAADLAIAELSAAHAPPVAIIANRVAPDDLAAVRSALAGSTPGPVAAIPEAPLLVAPTVEALQTAGDARLVRGNPEWLGRESMGFVVAAMSLPNVLIRLRESITVIAPGDRFDLLPGLVMAHQSGTFPQLASIVLTGGYIPPEPVTRLIEGVQQDLPIMVTELGTFETATRLAAVRGRITAAAVAKIEVARRIFAENVDGDDLLAALDVADSPVVTPLMFQHRLLERARSKRRHIVLPEGDEPRILAAAASLLRLGVAELTLLGDENAVRSAASAEGHDITGAHIVSPHDPELVERFAQEYAQLRAAKGMTVEAARPVVQDVSYFGTMMVHLGMADGMVSGAAHTTAHTIRPSFEIIRTKPGVAIVSSVFLMCLSDRVLVYGDCAVNPDPTAEQLADIAVSSAATAAEFGIDPRVALLSYSTGSSGAGADVEKVRAATALVTQKAPELLAEGPIQYDAAVDPAVAASKLPDSKVAGRATVLIFPDLNTGNNTYKAVQRSAGAVAIGPVLQGLNKPVNDLSRGALVADIVNTVAITAIQAAEQE